MSHRARFALAALACISQLCAGERAHAQDTAPPSTEQGAAAYQQALALYEQGKLEEALLQMRESYRLSARQELLYNIARLQSELQDCNGSLASYREYLEQVPDGSYREPAQRAVQELSTQCGEAKLVPPAPPLAVAASVVPVAPLEIQPAPAKNDGPQPSGSAVRWWGWSAIGAGAIAGAGAVWFTRSATDARDRFQQNVDARVAGGPALDYSLEDRQHRDQRWAQVLGIGGGALIAGGVLALLLAPRDAERAASVATLQVSPGLVAAGVTQSF